ncbi:MAG TPA: hypothetical protein VN788_00150 [Verrucomicrobiae bacterium]|nr:hypothetical protein [Verrucomicrobiae bacterium]
MQTKNLTRTAADELSYQNQLVRTGQQEYIGTIVSIAVGDDADYERPIGDPLIDRWGRLMQFGNLALPLSQSLDHSCLLVPGPLRRSDGVVDLPDWKDPLWRASNWSADEAEGRVLRDPKKDIAPLIPQRLADRTSRMLENSNFLVFQPVLYVVVRPELEGEMLSTFWKIICGPRGSDGTQMSFLVDRATGESHFFGGRYEIVAIE